MPKEPVDYSNPASILEENETQDGPSHDEMAFALGRIIAWVLEGKTLAVVGFRFCIFAYKVRPDLINGKTLDRLSRILGYGRSAGHKLSEEITKTFGIRGLNDRSENAREAYRRAWQRANGTPQPHTYNPLSVK